MKTSLLFDFNNLVMRNFLGVPEIYPKSKTPDYDYWEYLVFRSIYLMLRKFPSKEVVLAIDNGT
jgi:hypothetical protein